MYGVPKIGCTLRRRWKGVGDREEGKKGGGWGERVRDPFPRFRTFLSLPPPPLIAPVAQAR